jgi:hypothetical protein
METQENNHVLTAINAVMSSFAQQAVEQATKPLIERITLLESQLNKRHLVERNEDWVALLRVNLLDAVDNKIEAAIKNITADNITGFSEAVDEAVQNQAPLNADDIAGLSDFVKSEIDDHLDGDELESELTNKIRDAFQAAVDSL